MNLRDLLNVFGLAFAAAIAAAPAAMAADTAEAAAEAETNYPFVEGAAYLELGDDYTFQSDDPGSEINDLYFYGTLDLKFGLTPVFSANLGLTAEDVLGEYEPFENRAFADTGIFVHALNAQANIGNAMLMAGKFHPNFGYAWDNTPGIFGTYFAEDYELSEMVGFNGSYTFATENAGSLAFSAALFFADTSFLSNSIITQRGQLSVSDGGIANTGRLDNFTLTLDGSEVPALPGLTYQLGFRHLSAGDTEVADENGFVASVAKDTELANGNSLGFTGELAYFSHYQGTRDNALYLTSGVALYSGPWHGELSGAIRTFDYDDGGSLTDHLVQVSAGYGFENGFDISAGYGFTRAEDIDYHTLGLRLTKSLEFSTNQ